LGTSEPDVLLEHFASSEAEAETIRRLDVLISNQMSKGGILPPWRQSSCVWKENGTLHDKNERA
jgi:hypothetical protein